MILRKEKMLLKQMLSGAITKQQMKNRLKLYKFSGTLILLKWDDACDMKCILILTTSIYWAYWFKREHFCFVFRKCLVQMLAGTLHVLTYFCMGKCQDLTTVMSWPVASSSFLINHSPIILPFVTVHWHHYKRIHNSNK